MLLSRASACRPVHHVRWQGSRRLASLASLEAELKRRRLPVLYDHLVPTPSHLLDVAISDLVAGHSSHVRPEAADGDARLWAGNPHAVPLPSPLRVLPPGHHLIHFPPAVPGGQLLPDGTDPLQSPGPPFVRRMWAGGSVVFNDLPSRLTKHSDALLALDGRRAACVETIPDVTIKGQDGVEKIFVGIERKVLGVEEDNEDLSDFENRLRHGLSSGGVKPALVERRNIVFMRERGREQAIHDMEKARTRQLKSTTITGNALPTYTWTVVPDEKLLFRYSALSYNAHAIHLDPRYCEDVEGHRALLVHGPLSFTLMLKALQIHLDALSPGVPGKTGGKHVIKSVEYRNLLPLYVREPMKIAGLDRGNGRYSIWIETPEGGLAVKGTAFTGTTDMPGG